MIGCGRDQRGFLKNETGEAVIVNLSLQNPKQDPTKYLIQDALNGEASSNSTTNGIDNYFISFDSISNLLTLQLQNNESLDLGTARLDRPRDSIKNWEFNKIEAIGKNFKLTMEAKEIEQEINREIKIFSQNHYTITLK